jgi:MFS family permease
MKQRLRLFTYLAAFFLNFHLAIVAYSNSSFLAKELAIYLPGDTVEFAVGLLFSLSFLISALAVFRDEQAITKYGDMRLTRIMVLILIGVSIAMGFVRAPLILIALFIAFNTLGTVIRFNIDVYLGTLTNKNSTGRIRGIFLTVINLAWLATPFLAGQLIGSNERYDLIYLIAGIALLPMLYISYYDLRERKLPKEASQQPKIISQQPELVVVQHLSSNLVPCL